MIPANRLTEQLEKVRGLDMDAFHAAQARWDAIAKPLHGMGVLEDIIAQIAGVTGCKEVSLDRRTAVVLCADNGVVAEGVTQTDSSVTANVAGNMVRGEASISILSKLAKVELLVADFGMLSDVSGVRNCKVRYGTENIRVSPAMTRTEAEQAILNGMQLVDELAKKGCNLIATGEMGIGNTTTSSAVTAVLLGVSAEEVTGRGAGLPDTGLAKKLSVITEAIENLNPDAQDGIDVLSKVGGLDLAGLTGVFLGGAVSRIPVLIDGFISAAAALCAVRICPACRDFMIATHLSGEPGMRYIMDTLGLHPFLYAGMHLGEGTGAVAAIPMLDMALAVYRQMRTFEEIAVEAYQPYPAPDHPDSL